MTSTIPTPFESSVANYIATPNLMTLAQMNCAALQILQPEQEEPAWTPVKDPEALFQGFYEIRAVCDRRLAEEEISRMSGCLGYALRSTLAGEDLSDPSIFRLFDDRGSCAFTVLEYSYDSTKSRRDDPDFALAFDMAQTMIFSGSPMRTTDRAGIGTKGSRLVEGIENCNITFYVR